MEPLKPLPEPIREVTIPESFTPTQLIHAAECPLRGVFMSMREIPRLSSGPAAERGNVFHSLLENSAKGLINQDRSTKEAVKDEFQRLLEVAEKRLNSKHETAHFSRLSETVSPIEWHNLAAKFLSLAERLCEQSRERRPSIKTPTTGYNGFGDIEGTGLWHEVTIEAPSIRLRGRMDMLEIKSENSVTIRDYKTGRVKSNDGAILSYISRQLYLYALCVLVNNPAAKVNLVVSNGDVDHILGFDPAIAHTTHEWLTSMLTGLPVGATLPSVSLANVGAGCTLCSHRHVCPAYRNCAPNWWATGTVDHRFPLDVWGAVTSIEDGPASISIEIRDPFDRRVRIHRLDPSRFVGTSLAVSASVAFFDLSTNTKGAARGRFFGPRNFYELPSDSSERRAWSLSVFGR